MPPSVKSGNPDRRGYVTVMNTCLALAGSSILVPFVAHWGWALGLFIVSALVFIVLEAVSAPPANEAKNFQYFIRHNLSSKRAPVLVCLGDSLTHGNCSYSYTVDVPTQVAAALAMEPPKNNSIFADPLWVVNCGQNFITTHTIWRERLNKALDCHPDYLCLLIGTNDILGAYSPWYGAYMQRINGLPECPSLSTFTRNFHGILSHIQQASPMTQVGVCTLPPLGENVKSVVNQHFIRQANGVIEQATQQYGDKFTLIPLHDRLQGILEKERRPNSDWFALYPLFAAVQCTLFHLLPGMLRWQTLGNIMGGHVLLHDGIHMNDRAADELLALLVEWLVSKGIAKAIAVKLR